MGTKKTTAIRSFFLFFRDPSQKKMAGAAITWNQTRCNPGPDLSANPIMSTVAPGTRIRDVPHFGPFLTNQLRRYRIATVNGLLHRFVRPTPLTTAALHKQISHMLRNPSRNTCSETTHGPRRGKSYQVSDVNQCAFNSVVKLLKHAHVNWSYNIPGAQGLNYRRRGASGNLNVRECACQTTRARCRDFEGQNSRRCTWTAAGQTQFGRGACTPTNRAIGFRGHSRADEYNQRTSQVPNSTQARRVGNLDRGGGWYVRGWRTTTPPQGVRRRRRRLRGPTRFLHACGTGGRVATTAATPMAPSPTWDDRTQRAWARAVADRFKTQHQAVHNSWKLN